MYEYLWIFPLLLLVVGLPYTYYKKGFRFCAGFAYLVSVVIFMRLLFSCYGYEGIFSSFVYAAQLFTFAVSGKDIIEMLATVQGSISGLYVICVWTAYLLCPALTVGALLSFVKKGLDRTTLRTRLCKQIYIFTETNERVLVLAKDICEKNKKAMVVFSEDDRHEESSRILYVSSTPYEIYKQLNKTNQLHICFNDSDTGKMLDKLHSFLKMERTKKAEIHVFTNNPIAYEVIDGMKQEFQKDCIKVVSTNAILMREILWDYPLFTKMDDRHELTVSVLGVGDFGGYFAMNTLWCSVMPDCDLKLNLVDCDSQDNVLKRVSTNLPDGYFDIKVFNENINTNAFYATMSNSRLQNSDYILVSAGQDDINIATARKLRLYFERCGRHPFIIMVLKNQSRYTILKEALGKEDIVVTGGTENIYSYKQIFEDRFYNRAYEVYSVVEKLYENAATPAGFYRQSQVDIFSSYASAIHCKYKIYGLCENCEASQGEIERLLLENKQTMVELEHKRWVHFEILKGYIGVPSEKLFNFLSDNSKIGKIHKNEKLKMHACITDLKGLEQVDGLIQEITGKKQNLVKIDEEIAEQTAALWFMK